MGLHMEVLGEFGLLSPWGEIDESTSNQMLLAISDLAENADVSAIVLDLQRVEAGAAEALEALGERALAEGVSLRVVLAEHDKGPRTSHRVTRYDSVPEALEWRYEGRS